jgi:hypothetical protein
MQNDSFHEWATVLSAQIVELHLYSDDPAPITYGKISDLLLSMLILASMEWREIMLTPSEN